MPGVTFVHPTLLRAVSGQPTGAANNRPPGTGTSRRPAISNVAGETAITLGGSFTSSDGVKRQTSARHCLAASQREQSRPGRDTIPNEQNDEPDKLSKEDYKRNPTCRETTLTNAHCIRRRPFVGGSFTARYFHTCSLLADSRVAHCTRLSSH